MNECNTYGRSGDLQNKISEALKNYGPSQVSSQLARCISRLDGETFGQMVNDHQDGHRSVKMEIRFAERNRTFVALGVDGLKLLETMTCQ